MASAKKLASGSYRVQACKTIDGKKVIKSFTVSPKDFGGDWRKAKAQAEYLAREWAFNEEISASITTVGQAFKIYVDDKSNVLSPSTLVGYSHMERYFTDILDKDVNEIDNRTIQTTINQFAIDGINCKTIKNRIGFLLSALSYVGVDKRFKFKYPPKTVKELLPPEQEEFKRLLKMADDEERLIITLAGLYTLRRSELGGLWGEDILRDLNSIYVHTSRVRDLDRSWVRKPNPKTADSNRVIQIDPEIMALIPETGPKDFVFSLDPDQMTRRFEKLRDKACVNCRFHDLRKYAASIRSEMMPTKYVEADGGWKHGSAVLKTVYDKPFKEQRKAYAKKFNDKVINDYGDVLFGN